MPLQVCLCFIQLNNACHSCSSCAGGVPGGTSGSLFSSTCWISLGSTNGMISTHASCKATAKLTGMAAAWRNLLLSPAAGDKAAFPMQRRPSMMKLHAVLPYVAY